MSSNQPKSSRYMDNTMSNCHPSSSIAEKSPLSPRSVGQYHEQTSATHASTSSQPYSHVDSNFGSPQPSYTSGRYPKAEYVVTGRGKTSQGNRWDTRDYGPSVNPNPYHYSNKDGSYYYSNPNGSKYYNDGQGGSAYTHPSGWTRNESSGAVGSSSAAAAASDRVDGRAEQVARSSGGGGDVRVEYESDQEDLEDSDHDNGLAKEQEHDNSHAGGQDEGDYYDDDGGYDDYGGDDYYDEYNYYGEDY